MRHAYTRGAFLAAGAAILFTRAAAAQTPAGNSFLVHLVTTGAQSQPAVAVLPAGEFVVAWMEAGFYTEPTGRIKAQRFDVNGARVGPELLVQDGTDHGLPEVGGDRHGRMTVVWQQSGQSLWASRYGPAGEPLGGAFRVDDGPLRSHQQQLAVLADGRFVGAWINSVNVSSGPGRVRARLYDAQGSPLGPSFEVSGGGNQYQAPDVAVDGQGRFVVVWTAPAGLMGRRFAAGGLPAGDPFPVGSGGIGSRDSVAAARDGRFAVVWRAGDHVHGQRFDAGGQPLGAEWLATPAPQTGIEDVGIVMEADGAFIVRWAGSSAYLRRFEADATPRGDPVRIPDGVFFGHRMASDPFGNFVDAFVHRYRPPMSFTQYDVLAARYGWLTPVTAVLDPTPGPDTDGNGILEPGETVAFAPSWANHSGAARTFASTLQLSGPSGPVYEAVDDQASYGTVAAGAEAPCADCFAVRVSGARPVLHWDAVARERVTPEALGQQGSWLLHVGDSFDDVPRADAYYPYIERLLHSGAISGCGGRAFCPAGEATRAQMALLVLKAAEGPGYSPPACGVARFSDVPADSPYCAWIEEAARRGVVSGCGGGGFCPAAGVRRDEAAVIALRALDAAPSPSACTAPVFDDVPATSPFCRWVEELVRRGVVSGCSQSHYCPGAILSRAQAAVFVARTFALPVYSRTEEH